MDCRENRCVRRIDERRGAVGVGQIALLGVGLRGDERRLGRGRDVDLATRVTGL
jgi:hypothetical protein